jgi:hypothetical protein
VRYGFLTTAFDRGTQSPWLAEVRENERRRRGFFDLGPLFGRDGRQRRMRTYLDAVLEFDRQRVPEAARLAREVMESIPPEQRTRARVARELEQFLATSPEFAYTLDLTAKPIPNVDPVQQFLAFDRRGHCQYFASALALMLRSVGIPSRVVVGYRTEEYNALGKYYIARQQHAHAWVEALIDLDEMPNGVRLPLQPRAERFWMRLDPTPAESAEDDGNREGVNGLLNLANNIWEDYVVEMDSERQSKDLVNATGLDRVQNSYRGLFDALERRLSATSRGRLSGRSLSSPGGIPVWPLLIGILAAAVFVAARHVRWPRRKARADPSAHGGEQRGTSVEFYRHALEQLRRVGIERQDHETPGELSDRVGTDFPGFAALTEIFIRHRYGHATLPAPQQLEPRLNELRSAVEAKLTQAADGTATSKRANG